MTTKPKHPFVIVGASVSLKWVLNDEDAVAQAVALRDAAIAGRFEMVAPTMWLYEVMDGLLTAIRWGRFAVDKGPALL